MQPYSLEKIELVSKHPIVLMKLAAEQDPLMTNPNVTLKYTSIGQKAVIVLQGDGSLSQIINGKALFIRKLSKMSVPTQPLEEVPLIQDESSEESQQFDSEDMKEFDGVDVDQFLNPNSEDQSEKSEESGDIKSKQHKDENKDDGIEIGGIEDLGEMDDNSSSENSAHSSETSEKEGSSENSEKSVDTSKSFSVSGDNSVESENEEKNEEQSALPTEESPLNFVIPTVVSGLHIGVFDVGYDCVYSGSYNSLPIRQYNFDGTIKSSPVCQYHHICAAVADEEIFLGTTEGLLQRYSFIERKKMLLSKFKFKITINNTLSNPVERRAKIEDKHPLITLKIDTCPIRSVCPFTHLGLVVCATCEGKIYIVNTMTNLICGSLRGPQGSVKLYSSGDYLIGICLDRWAYVWDLRLRKPVSKIYLKRMPSCLAISN
ncbi:hypothetical protein EIN_135130 [Entamoeba invadens IP1]|uniref:Uncharacterized protein n=1 Tax=Entamoeba invadens IP1 TaxID=370355 RepID=A0A0A1U2Z8_ENTIV|nr:hypothetical protein EIN_135130 [Entamoeba invadens IP1]ELP85929.1 hypothetical protein EIN_135130 [Entamoeba invadens IP1]|eukprot:XP_004185275.1 hypothetical protein EIN_135130 [Entamoeba invadens IP1]